MLRDPFTGHTNSVTSVAFSADGLRLAAGSDDDTIIMWDVKTGQTIGQPFVGSDFITSIGFSPDGQMLASGDAARNMLLWDVNRGETIGQPFIGHNGRINTLAYSSDGLTVATGSSDTSIILWDVSLASWQRRACSIANRNLTSQEWERYFQSSPYRETCPG